MRGARPAALQKSFREFSPQAPSLWPEGNVTLGYLSTLNTWAKGLNLLLLLDWPFEGQQLEELFR
jgi:hypothetical protein